MVCFVIFILWILFDHISNDHNVSEIRKSSIFGKNVG